MAGPSGCPDHQTLTAYLFGTLPQEQEAAVGGHVEQCADCEARVQQIEQQTDPLVEALRYSSTGLSAPAKDNAEASPVLLDDIPRELEGYRILEEIGRGGMGVVYRGYQHRLNRQVAIKMILAGQM